MTREGPPLHVRASGGSVEVRLPETPTSGYTWSVTSLPDALREAAGSGAFEAAPPAADARAPVAGGGGERVFRFLVLAPGEHVLEVSLGRPWEVAPLERRLVTVSVPSGSPPPGAVRPEEGPGG